MATTYSTYANMIEDVISEVHELGEFNHDHAVEQQILRWVNDAMHRITSDVDFVKLYTLVIDENSAVYTIAGSGNTISYDYIAPTEIKDIVYISRTWGNFYREIKYVTIQELLKIRERDTAFNASYSDADSPSYAASYVNASGNTEIMFYPTADDEYTISLWLKLLVDPRVRNSSALTTSLVLPSIYDQAIKLFCISRVYRSILKDMRMSRELEADFERELVRLKKASGTGTKNARQHITYK